ncbi:MAG TPA: glycosyltransferase family 87 protein [Novosphingobium sp.]
MGVDFFRRADWLGEARARGYLWCVALLNVAALVLLVASSHGGIDRNGFLLGTDFISFWTTGHMLHAHANVYDIAAHTAAQRTFFASNDSYTAFFYPPTFLPFCWPLGLLGYFPALALWLAATGGTYLLAVRAWLNRVGVQQPALVLFAAFPPVLITVTHGQTAFLVATLLGLGGLLALRRPWLAGLLFGLATIKPQFGLLLPVALLLTGEWRVIAGAVLGAGALGLASTVAFGPQIWADWFHIGGAAQGAMDNGTVGYAKMQSLLAAAMLLGAPGWLAYLLQGALTLAIVGAVAWASWGRRFDLPLAALVLAGAPLVTPFVLDYDMVLLAFPLIWLASEALETGFRPWEKLVFVLTFIAGTFARPLAMFVGVPIMPVVLIAFFLFVLRRVNESPRTGRVVAGAGSGASPSY